MYTSNMLFLVLESLNQFFKYVIILLQLLEDIKKKYNEIMLARKNDKKELKI